MLLGEYRYGALGDWPKVMHMCFVWQWHRLSVVHLNFPFSLGHGFCPRGDGSPGWGWRVSIQRGRQLLEVLRMLRPEFLKVALVAW